VSEAEVTREGLRGVRPGRDATPGTDTMPGTEGGRRRRGRAGRWKGTGRRAEQPMVPPAEFASYYGRPILNAPVWRSPQIPGCLFLGGLAGGSSLLAASAATRWGIFHAGLASAADPKYTVVPQRERREARQPGPAGACGQEQAGADAREKSGARGQERAGPRRGAIA
jgi:hypothetical protein